MIDRQKPRGHLMMAYAHIEKVTEGFGTEAACELVLFQRAQVYAIQRVVEKESLDCDLVLTQACEATQVQEIADERRVGYGSY
jgi:hypothetical protein